MFNVYRNVVEVKASNEVGDLESFFCFNAKSVKQV